MTCVGWGLKGLNACSICFLFEELVVGGKVSKKKIKTLWLVLFFLLCYVFPFCKLIVSTLGKSVDWLLFDESFASKEVLTFHERDKASSHLVS